MEIVALQIDCSSDTAPLRDRYMKCWTVNRTRSGTKFIIKRKCKYLYSRHISRGINLLANIYLSKPMDICQSVSISILVSIFIGSNFKIYLMFVSYTLFRVPLTVFRLRINRLWIYRLVNCKFLRHNKLKKWQQHLIFYLFSIKSLLSSLKWTV